MGMFDFVLDQGNHEEREVDNYEANGLCIDTCRVSDGLQPFETGIQHPAYKEGKWVIVEAYDSKEAAQVGHDKWLAAMTSQELPIMLSDCANAEMADALLGCQTFNRVDK